MNCLFTLKHKRTEQIVKIYGTFLEEWTKRIVFIVWDTTSKKFIRIAEYEFEPCSNDLKGEDYTS